MGIGLRVRVWVRVWVRVEVSEPSVKLASGGSRRTCVGSCVAITSAVSIARVAVLTCNRTSPWGDE